MDVHYLSESGDSMKKYRLSLLIIGLVFLATACQSFKPKEEAPKDYVLPEVSINYSKEEVVAFHNSINQGTYNQYEGLAPHNQPILKAPEHLPSALFYDSGIQINYPKDGVKGVYVPASVFNDPDQYQFLLDLLDNTYLNAMVIDFKDDYGNVLAQVDTKNPLVQKNSSGTVDFKKILKDLEKHEIYPIARIVTFKDNLLSSEHPEYSFKDRETGAIWSDGNGSQFINPFMKEVWDYDVEVAIEAAKLGFKEIQFDYVRFPEGFETFSDKLEYDIGDFGDYVTDDVNKFGQERVYAINGFLEYAREKLAPYGAETSADVFGYTAIAGDAPDVRGIGQNFAQMAERVDVISSMVYPSHWGPGFFGIAYPDLEPYNVVDQYMYSEKAILANTTNQVTSRPWLQSFTDYGLAPGTFQEYGPLQIQQQIVALSEYGIHEYLLWNASGSYYSEGVDYAPELSGQDYYY